jgi:hypothetical protein
MRFSCLPEAGPKRTSCLEPGTHALADYGLRPNPPYILPRPESHSSAFISVRMLFT